VPKAFAALIVGDNQDSEWFTDIGALNCMILDEGNLFNLGPFTRKDCVMVGNGDSLKISHTGDAHINLGQKSIDLKSSTCFLDEKQFIIN